MPSRAEKIQMLSAAIRQLNEEMDVESLAGRLTEADESTYESTLESQAASTFESIDPETDSTVATEKVLSNREDQLDDAEIAALEAIVLPRGRPVAFIRNGKYDDLESPWEELNRPAVRNRLEPLFGAIGRVELPNSLRIPYGGTGFVVGRGLLMTNRHVAELFTDGLGTRLVYQPGDAAVHFRRHLGDPQNDTQTLIIVKKVVMIHPYWDMALLQVDGLATEPLPLSVERPEDFLDRNVAVVGYPARDDRSDLALQDRIFQRTYNVKRIQPGKIRRRQTIRSFENTVSALTHDSSTLGGNSGSAIVDIQSGGVLGLHFAGVYLRANYGVPTYELARDPRVVDAGVKFKGTVPRANRDLDAIWARANGESPGLAYSGQSSVSRPAPVANPDLQPAPAVSASAGGVTFTVPLQVSVSIGSLAGAIPSVAVPATAVPSALVEAARVPVIFPNLDQRTGYDPDYLQLEGHTVPMLELTAAGKRLAARLEDGSTELKYHKFSIMMHKRRRMALFTAANVDWRRARREVNGRRPSRDQLTGLGPNDVERWVTDARIPDAHQLPDVFFTQDRGSFDRGHLVRRDDVCWGDSFEDIQMANGDTFHTTNCSPQIAGFNQSSRGVDNWGDLENLVQQQTSLERTCIFSGPVFTEGDRIFRGRDLRGEARIQIPQKYWKVIVSVKDGEPAAYGFVLEQDLSNTDLELTIPAPWRRLMSSLDDIEESLGGLVRLTRLKRFDQFGSDEGVALAEAVRR